MGKKPIFPKEFCQTGETSSKVDISHGAQKEIKFLYLYDIVSKVDQRDIPSALIVNIDQTPLKYVPVGDETMATKREHYVTIEGSANKRSITGTFAISLDRNFLPVQLIRGGKITRSLQWFEFLKDFSLSTNLKHFSNTNEWRKFLKEVIKPYVIKRRQILKCSADQKAPIIMGVFNG